MLITKLAAPMPGAAERRLYMAFPLSIVGGLLLVGYAFSRMNARQGAKRNIQTILDTNKDR
jgi:hypothetical protein